MNRLTPHLLALTMISTAIAADPARIEPVFPGVEWEVAAPESQGVDSAKLTAAMDYLRSVCGELGTSKTVVVRAGRVIWQGEDVRVRQPVWSCTKSITSACLGLLWDDGKLTPATLAAEQFPELKLRYPTVTLEHLATFTSGYDGEKEDVLRPKPPMFAPGAAYHYNAQSDLLAAFLTRTAREPLQDLFRRRVGEVIGLTDVDFSWNSARTLDGIRLNGGSGMPETGVEANALGMARFGWLFCNGGRWRDKQVISQEYIRYATAPRVPSDTPPWDPKAWYVDLPGCYGLNWWVNGIDPHGQRMWPSAPASTFAAQGNRNNICIIIPEWQVVIVRLGGDKVIDNLYDPMFALLREGME